MVRMEITLTELEDAINFWRARKPSTSEACVLCMEASALAGPYAAMIMHHLPVLDEAAMSEPARAAVSAWRQARQALAPVKG